MSTHVCHVDAAGDDTGCHWSESGGYIIVPPQHGVVSDSTAKPSHARKRPWLAVLLTILVPGLGHLYLRLWLRAILWLVLYITATAFVLPDNATPDSFSIDAFVAASDAVPLQAALLVLGISLFCILDAYMMSNHINQEHRRESGEAVSTCPNCGKTVDDDLDFCHWCTTRLEDPETE